MNELSEKLVKRLQYLALMSEGDTGMYPGDWWETAGRQYFQLERLGFVERYYPHNPVHKTRAVITPKGKAYLAEKELNKRNPQKG